MYDDHLLELIYKCSIKNIHDFSAQNETGKSHNVINKSNYKKGRVLLMIHLCEKRIFRLSFDT